MTLEDFFTLTETKDGLSTLPRVEELIFALKKQKECVLDISGDASRQWSIVIGTLAATENKDCLNHFVHLNGLSFLNQWLLQGQKCDKDVSEDMLVGLITALLAMLEKLPIDKEKLSVSGIRSTVEHLLGHKSLDVKEKAKILSDKWNDMSNDISRDSSEDRGTSLNDQAKPSDVNTTENGVGAVCPVFRIFTAEGGSADCEVKSLCAESQLSNVTKCSDSSQMAISEDAKISVSKLISTTLSNSVCADAALGDLKSLGSSLVSNSGAEKSFIEESSVCPSVGLSSTCKSPVYEGREDDHRDIYVVGEASEGTKQMEVEVSTKEGSPCKSSKKESSIVSSSSGLSDTLPSSQDDSKGSKGVDIVIPNDSLTSEKTKVLDQMDQKSGLGLEYEEFDALEVACQVALEVEREVVNYREPFCSSPEANSGKTMEIHSPVGKLEQSLIKDLDSNMLLAAKDLSDDASSPKNQKTQIPESTGGDPQECEQPLESPKLASIAHGSAGESDKNKLDFDLNEDICTEEFNCLIDLVPSISVNLSAPKAIFATSKGVPNLPVAPLQFEGEMGWKGSAATSAFRPASPRKTPDCEKASSSLNKKHNFLEIDLNVAESECDMAVDPISVKQMPAFFPLPSGDSSVEVSSRRAERLMLDLNRLGDEDMSVNPSSCYRLQHQNEEQSLSSASSSSPRQRDFDLNDNPCFMDAGGSSKVSTTNYGASRFNDPARVMGGSRRDVERKDYLVQAHPSFLGNELNLEAVITARQAQPYAHLPPYYGYNGYPAGPIMPIPPSLHGPGSIPYAVDPRGVAVIPHTLGSAIPNASHSAGLPFVISGAPSSMNGVGPSRSGFDLNSCMTSVESESREGVSFRQLFIHDHNALLEEKARISSQPSSSSMSLKRKEPECGWETYVAGYNPMMPWQ